MLQYKDDENVVISYLSFSGGNQYKDTNNVKFIFIVFGNMLGMLFSSFLSSLMGGIGPFAMFGKFIKIYFLRRFIFDFWTFLE